MAVLTYSEIKNLAYDRAQVNVTTDAPVSDNEFDRLVNDAYADVWELSGGTSKQVAHSDAWYESSTTTRGLLHGRLTDIGEISALFVTDADEVAVDGDKEIDRVEWGVIEYLRANEGFGLYNTRPKVFAARRIDPGANLASDTAASWTAADDKITADTAGAFANIRVGHQINKAGLTGIADNAVVVQRISNSVVVLDAITANSSGNVQFDGTNANRLQVGLWPAVASIYVALEYIPQFTPIDSTTITTPAVNDLESRDIALLTALKIVPLVGRAELAPSIAMDISERTRAALDRKMAAMLHGAQDR